MKYRFIKAHVGEFEVQIMCQALGVSRSGYCAWCHRGEKTAQESRDAELRQRIQAIFESSQGTYGSPRVHAELKAQGIACSRDHMADLMRQAYLNAALPRRRVRTTQSDGSERSAANVLNRDFSASAPNQKWVVDITSIDTDEGWLYLAGALDLVYFSGVRLGGDTDGDRGEIHLPCTGYLDVPDPFVVGKIEMSSLVRHG